MMKILILISSFAIAALSFTQTYEWRIQYGNTTDAQTTNITTDANGNVYAVGTFSGMLDCDPSAATQNVTSNGNIDFFITKVSPSGTLIWVKSIGGSANYYAKTVVTDQVGDVYIGGSYQSTVDFDPNAGVASRTSATVDAFILKQNS